MIKKFLPIILTLSVIASVAGVEKIEVKAMTVKEEIVSSQYVKSGSGGIKVGNSNDLQYYDENSAYGKMIDEMATQIREMLNSGANEGVIERKVTINLNGNGKGTQGLENYIVKRLNNKEKKLYYSNKAKALVCMSEGVLAIKKAEQYYDKSVLYNGNGDAFRHTLWCCGMVVDVGYTFAKKWSDAHEDGDKVQPLIVKNMDLFNNKVGLKLGKDCLKVKKSSVLIKRAKDKVSGGKCRRIVGDALVVTNKEGLKAR